MVLIVFGGQTHPLNLIKAKQLADQRADFLKSRPRFNDSYFDGQRDPAQGWMAAGSAWRYPAFFVSPAQEEGPEFTFTPSHTLFIDANLQVRAACAASCSAAARVGSVRVCARSQRARVLLWVAARLRVCWLARECMRPVDGVSAHRTMCTRWRVSC
jgi:hypothetical protein